MIFLSIYLSFDDCIGEKLSLYLSYAHFKGDANFLFFSHEYNMFSQLENCWLTLYFGTFERVDPYRLPFNVKYFYYLYVEHLVYWNT